MTSEDLKIVKSVLDESARLSYADADALTIEIARRATATERKWNHFERLERVRAYLKSEIGRCRDQGLADAMNGGSNLTPSIIRHALEDVLEILEGHR